MFSKSEKSTPQQSVPILNETQTQTQVQSRSATTPKRPAGVPSIVSEDLRITGSLSSEGEVQIDGYVEGDITAQFVTVSAGATIDGSITAETAHISGTVSGQVEADSVMIAKPAKVKGDVVHQSLAIESGAYIEGFCKPRGSNLAAVESRPAVVCTGGNGCRPEIGRLQ
jgi:cytoskeletal protein CcmA (bactofilin family)